MSYLTGFDNLIRDERQMKALVGVGVKEFKFLVPYFRKLIKQTKEEEYLKRVKRRKKKVSRKAGIEHSGNLDTTAKKLFFILNYLKTYPTFDVHGANFDYNRGTACIKVHKLTFVFLKTLRSLRVAPKREIKSPEDFEEAFGKNLKKILLDATERRHFRHKNYKKQKENFSGKKNSTQRKTY